MTRIIFIAGLIFITEMCLAQAADLKIDSLSNILKNKSLPDSTQVTILLNLSDANIYRDPDESMKYADLSLQLARKLQWQKGIALALRQKGNVYYVLSDNLNAMDCFQQALNIGESLNIRFFNASVMNNIANIYSDLAKYDLALEYYNRLLSISRELKLQKQQIIAHINIGTVYTELKEYATALKHYQESLQLAEKAGNKRYAASILNNMGITYDKSGDFKNALKYFNQSVELSREVSNKYSEAASLNGIAKIYIKQGDEVNAEKYGQRSLTISQEIKAVEWQAEAWQTLSAIYEDKHHYEKALDAYRQYIILRDSVMNEQKKSELTRKEMQYKFDKKEALAQAALGRQRLVKNSILAGALLFLLAGITSFVFYKRKRDAEGLKKEAEFKALVSETEMKALRAQMNPHFIFNSLNSISDYIAKHDTAAADYYLTKFSQVMRLILEHSDQKEISLSDELKTLELYMQLETMRLKNKFSYEMQVEKSIDPESTLVPPLILQPFVENSIWHGISKKEGKGKILINITKEGEMIHCTVKDNGIGRKQSAAIEHERIQNHKKSMGMKITNARIDIINKIKRTNAGVELSDLEEGLSVQVRLPLELNF